MYSFGIFAFFEHASSLLKSEVIDLIIRFYVPLGNHLNKCLQSMVISLIPALEDESTDFYSKSLFMFEAIANCVSARNLIEKIWTALLLAKKHRSAVINYLVKAQPKAITAEDAPAFCAGQPSLVVSAICAALEDPHALVVRRILDIIVLHFPMHCTWLSNEQKVSVTKAILSVLTRRDMSLSRRIYSWLLSQSDTISSIEADSHRFADTSASCVVSAIKLMISEARETLIDSLARPYRILVFLNDRPAIIQPIFGAVVFPLLKLLRNRHSAQSSGFDKVRLHLQNYIAPYSCSSFLLARIHCESAV